MCGIFVSVIKRDNEQGSSAYCRSPLLKKVQEQLLRRGPDCYSEYSVDVCCTWKLFFAGSVLWMQGQVPTQQPHVDMSNILLWNGDIFDGPLVPSDGGSDTAILLKQLVPRGDDDHTILETLASVNGPYAMIYMDMTNQKLWFGRDRLGRHSLLWYFEEHGKLVLTSVGKKGIACSEVPAIGVFMIDFRKSGPENITVYLWSDVKEESTSKIQEESCVPFKIAASRVQSPIIYFENFVECEPPEEYLNLINQYANTNLPGDVLKSLLLSINVSDRVTQLIIKLKKSVSVRTKTHPGVCSKCIDQCESANPESLKMKGEGILKYSHLSDNCHHPKIAVLFSGGLDSTILAALANEFIPTDEPIDLINVAFECTGKRMQLNHSRKQKLNYAYKDDNFDTPDRKTGLQSYEELKTLFPKRKWNFVQVDVHKEELDRNRSERIADLIHPLNTILDDSLGCALWFASRRKGTLLGEAYTSPARVLLLGMGADELFGGYMRHRNLLRYSGWQAVADEMQLELARISTRNLGRDDRVVADNGCQGRFPYLDEEVVSFANSLPPWARCYPTDTFPPGLGDKLLLRLVAWSCGLQRAATIPKRAFQFGSRIANSKEKASNLSSRLMEVTHTNNYI